mgnify:FL=1
MLAVQTGNERVVEVLLANGVKCLQRDHKGRTALEYGLHQGRIEVFEPLFARNADTILRDFDGNTLLISAAKVGNVKLMLALLDRGAKCNHVNSDGHSALMSAVRKKNVMAIQVLLARGALTDLRDRWGRTAWDYALDGKSYRVLDCLATYGKIPPPNAISKWKSRFFDPLAYTILLEQPQETNPTGLAPVMLADAAKAIVPRLMRFDAKTREWLMEMGFALPIVDEMCQVFGSDGTLEQALAGAGKKMTGNQKRYCCAGFLLHFCSSELFKSWYGKTRLLSLSETGHRFDAMLERQVNWLADAGESFLRKMCLPRLERIATDVPIKKSGKIDRVNMYKSLTRDTGLFDMPAWRMVDAVERAWAGVKEKPADPVSRRAALLQLLPNALTEKGKGPEALEKLREGDAIAGEHPAFHFLINLQLDLLHQVVKETGKASQSKESQ